MPDGYIRRKQHTQKWRNEDEHWRKVDAFGVFAAGEAYYAGTKGEK
jgi:hypothetical protein